MAVITAAITATVAAVSTVGAAAAGAATVAAAVSAVASAVVAVSTAVGVAGLVVGGIGMAIGNEDLMFAGKIMGYVGMAGGLAGGLIGGVGAVATESGLTFAQGFGDAFAGASQHLSNAWDKGVGGWFSGGEKVTGTIGGAADDVATGATKGPMSSPGATPDGKGMGTFSEVVDSPTTIKTPVDTGTYVNVGPRPQMSPAPVAQTVSPPTAQTVVAPSPQSVAVPEAANSLVKSYTPISGPQNMATTAKLAAGGAQAGGGGGLVDTLSSMPDWMKYSMATTGLQGVTGLAGGYFQGKSAEEQLELQKLQAQREQDQRQLLNRQGNQIPSFRFNA